MSHTITSEDKRLSLSRWLDIRLKFQILNSDDTVLDEIVGFTDLGSISIDATSYVRRSYNLTIVPTDQHTNLADDSLIWIDKTAKVQVGMKTPRDDDYTWYDCGVFIFTATSTTINTTENTMTITCGDKYNLLDGTTNGQLGALTTTIPAYEEDDDGNPTSYNVIRDVLMTILNQLGGIPKTKIFLDDIGEYKGMSQYNDDYETYRANHPQWNCIPYDLEYSVGSSVANIISEIIELYPNNDAAFDESGNFVAQMIPSCYEDDVILTNDEIQQVLSEEKVDTDLTAVRNIVHVWGETFDVDWYTEDVTNSNSTYLATVTDYGDSYSNGDLIALKIPSTNASTQYINVNSIENIQIYDEDTDEALEASTLSSDTVYVFKLYKTYQNSAWVKKFYLQGQWQAHGLYALVDGSINTVSYTCTDGTETTLYTKEYFQDKYSVSMVNLKVIADSPFAVQKIGERLDAKSDGEYANITSDSLALSRAEYELYKDARLTDNITIVLSTIVPWLKEYMKVSYIKQGETDELQYITKSITLNLSDGTTTITMYRFYPLYEEE